MDKADDNQADAHSQSNGGFGAYEADGGRDEDMGFGSSGFGESSEYTSASADAAGDDGGAAATDADDDFNYDFGDDGADDGGGVVSDSPVAC